MEKLKSLVPVNLKRMISEGTTEDLLSTCSSLLQFFLSLQLFHNVVRELTDPKMALCGKNRTAAMDLKRKGNDCFSAGDYGGALSSYSQALRVAPADDGELVATLYVNRASSLHKMGLFTECLRDCNRAVVLSPSYAKAWYRRGKANASLENYDEATNDMNVAMNLEFSLGQKCQIKNELDLIVNKGRSPSSSLYKHMEKNLGFLVELAKIELQCVSTPDKGRGMVSVSDIPPSSLIHSEEPCATILSKHCRETHCHFCLNKLPLDTVPCSSCSIPLYCSWWCQAQAGGQGSSEDLMNCHPLHETISADAERYIASVILASNSEFTAANPGRKGIAEHKHECGGMNWPVILPSEIILAGRIIAKSIEQSRQSVGTMKPVETLELSHSYDKLSSEHKLEFHIYSVVLTHCLQQSYSAELPMNGASASQLVILFAQVKLNSMAIVHMKSMDGNWPMEQSGKLSPAKDALTNDIEQVRVGQAIYSSGSLFNHSCQPNIHAYFLSRTLFVRSTEFVPAGCPLELSYGPQVGQWSRRERQLFLQDQYSFKCMCSGCSELNFSDIVISSFSCAEPNCFGAVLDDNIFLEKLKCSCVQDVPTTFSLKRPLPVDKLKREDFERVAHCLLNQEDGGCQMDPGCCLNCGLYNDIESLRPASVKAMDHIKRLQDSIISTEVHASLHSDAWTDLNLLRSTLHAYNKEIAQAEDYLAKTLCLIGNFKMALHHCKASIEILKKLYHPKHIVIGHELVKLASIQLCMGDHISAVSSIDQLDAIFSIYYGSHATRILPYLESLKKDAARPTLEKCALKHCSSS